MGRRKKNRKESPPVEQKTQPEEAVCAPARNRAIIESIDQLLSQKNLVIKAPEVIEEALALSAKIGSISNDDLADGLENMWKDIRTVFRLLDKVGVQVARTGKLQSISKAAIVAIALEIRRQVKADQKDLARFRKDMEKEVKSLKETHMKLLEEIKSFKKMMDLYINPPAQMGPVRRRDHKPFPGLAAEIAAQIKGEKSPSIIDSLKKELKDSEED